MNIKQLEQIDLSRKNILKPQQLCKKNKKVENKPLNIVYLMAWTQVCGGSKIILEYANKIQEAGNNVTIITYDVKPKWYKINDNINFIQVPDNENWKEYIPSCDLIVATSWKCIYTAVESKKAPVVFFEQGGAHIFDSENINIQKKQVVQERLNLVPYIYTVSTYTKNKIKEVYGKDANVICNAVDNEVFYSRKSFDINKKNIDITIIGSEDFKFKNIDDILQAIRILKQKYNNINLNWITQTAPTKNKEVAIVNPRQKEIGEILRNTDIYICNSDYESFGLPTLEAMTCGAAVITTDTGGMRDFAIDKYNALVIKKNNLNDIIEKTEILINDVDLRKEISKRGMETAKKFSWENSVKQTLNYYQEISSYKVIDKG